MCLEEQHRTQRFYMTIVKFVLQNKKRQRTNNSELEMLFKVKYPMRTLNKDLHMLLVLLGTVHMCEGH